MRRKRQRRGTWFPTLGTGINEGADSVSGISASIPLLTTGLTNAAIVPITFDDPQEDKEATPESQLLEFVGQEYILHSIIGSFLASYSCNPAGGSFNDIPAALVVAGFFVARSADDAGGTTDTLPIGAATVQEIRDNYSPLSGQTIREPWIWRRAWILGQSWPRQTANGFPIAGAPLVGTGVVGSNGQAFPSSTAGYASLASGPFFRTKTRRRVRQDERLWFSVAAVNWPLETLSAGQTNQVDFYLDYRIFGDLVKAKNRSAF